MAVRPFPWKSLEVNSHTGLRRPAESSGNPWFKPLNVLSAGNTLCDKCLGDHSCWCIRPDMALLPVWVAGAFSEIEKWLCNVMNSLNTIDSQCCDFLAPEHSSSLAWVWSILCDFVSTASLLEPEPARRYRTLHWGLQLISGSRRSWPSWICGIPGEIPGMGRALGEHEGNLPR